MCGSKLIDSAPPRGGKKVDPLFTPPTTEERKTKTGVFQKHRLSSFLDLDDIKVKEKKSGELIRTWEKRGALLQLELLYTHLCLTMWRLNRLWKAKAGILNKEVLMHVCSSQKPSSEIKKLLNLQKKLSVSFVTVSCEYTAKVQTLAKYICLISNQ